MPPAGVRLVWFNRAGRAGRGRGADQSAQSTLSPDGRRLAGSGADARLIDLDRGGAPRAWWPPTRRCLPAAIVAFTTSGEGGTVDIYPRLLAGRAEPAAAPLARHKIVND
jgi:hypothetical protein